MNDVSIRKYKVLAGIAAVMFGVAQGTVAFVDIAPRMTGGIIALLGGIYIIDQVQEQKQEMPNA